MMKTYKLRNAFIALVLCAIPTAAFSQIAVGISVRVAPPVLPVYVQPRCPTPGYLWTPGYWAYGPNGYYWVRGVWVAPPRPGLLWTPGYWGFAGGVYGWHPGYWGLHVGFYGGVNYGFGYGGVGFVGGRWAGGVFRYNTAVMRVDTTVIHNTYVDRKVIYNRTVINNHASFNGPGGSMARPTPMEQAAMREPHFQLTAQQRAFHNQAMKNARDGFGHGNEVNTRQGNQQQRISQGVRSGQLTPGETHNLENRESSINRQTQADRAANDGRLTGQERQQINQRQNNVSRSIYNDKHNANTDAAAARRNGRTAQSERRQAQRTKNNARPRR
ncbi:MAG: YXWGXW repeat-containing protein [Acidobacteriaceae bacterium]